MSALIRLRHPVRMMARWLTSTVVVLASVAVPAGRTNASGDDAITVAGGHGNGFAANQLSWPIGVAVAGDGDVFVADTYNYRVQKWKPGGVQGVTVAGGHGNGSAANQLEYPEGVAVDSLGDLFVADGGNRVQEWTPGANHGVTVAGGHGPGSAANQLHDPAGVAVDGRGDVFVADWGNQRVQEWAPGAALGVTVAGGHGWGSAPNQLVYAVAVAVDGHGDVFVSDWGNQRVQEWTPDATQGITVVDGMRPGRGSAEQLYPWGLAVDGDGDIFVVDPLNSRVEEWQPGAPQGVIVAGGHGEGSAADQLSFQFPSAGGVALDGHGHLFVADANNFRVQEILVPTVSTPVDPTLTELSFYTTTSDSQAPPVRPGDHVVVVATVRALSGTTAATGRVIFYDGSTDLGAIPLYPDGATGYAILFTAPMSAGIHTVTARYSSDGTCKPSSAAPLSIVVPAH